jgi:hypothetical protein
VSRLAAVVLVVAAAASCGGPGPSTPELPQGAVFLPIHRPMNGGPVAIIGGRLVEREGCLLFEDLSGRSLALWPPGTTIFKFDASTWVVGDASRRPIVAVGDNVSFGGGTDYPLDFAEELIGRPIPGPCRVGNYTLVNSLERLE